MSALAKAKANELVDGLEGVTPGPWTWGMKFVSRPPDDGTITYEKLCMTPDAKVAEEGSQWEMNAAHIARCSPDNIRLICEAIEAQAAELERVKAELENEQERVIFIDAAREAAESALSERTRALEGMVPVPREPSRADIEYLARQWGYTVEEAMGVYDLILGRFDGPQREAAKPLKGGPQYASEEVQRFAIDVEKVLCAKLGRPWSATGISIVSLIDELATLRAPSESEAIRALQAVVATYRRDNPMRTADMHNPACTCMRCAIDNAAAAIERNKP